MFFLPSETYMPGISSPRYGMKYKYLDKAEDYAQTCRKNGLLANKAGFFRQAKITPKQYGEFRAKHPDEAALIDALFEDEALNADTKKLSSTVLNLYMKCKLGYGEKENSEVSVVSGHDGEDAL